MKRNPVPSYTLKNLVCLIGSEAPEANGSGEVFSDHWDGFFIEGRLP